MKPVRKLNRRSFLARVAGGAAVGGGAFSLLGPAVAQTGITDRDPSDRVGYGRGGGTGVTDQDSGPGADPAGRGRGLAPPQGAGVTDSDSGSGADPVGRGRGTGVTDSDSFDRRGFGRQVTPQMQQAREACARDRQRLAEMEETARSQSYWTDAQLREARVDVGRLRRVAQQYADLNARRGQISAADYDAESDALLEEFNAVRGAYGIGALQIDQVSAEIQRRIQIAERTTTQRAEFEYQMSLLRRSLQDRRC